eukprot:GFYU01007204.1.p1 GENE.GFYU01007204.1~~GFYU01007204.1.p1  ORF type:complete len:294 (-),score=83.71 GFYU01007204.1:24-905(-)
MVGETFQSCLKTLAGNPNDKVAAKELLKIIRKDKIRRPDVVSTYGHMLLEKGRSFLGFEVYTVLEQTFLADLDCGNVDEAQMLFAELHRQFPDSTRVKKLLGMQYEAKGDFEGADEIYQEILEDDKANLVVMKRRIAILKELGQTGKAIDQLNAYLKNFMMDKDAWLELLDLHIANQQYVLARFCAEELVLLHPQNPLYHTRLAEVMYTLGGVDNLKLARKHYSQALEFHPTYMRALLGLSQCTTMIATFKNASDTVNEQLQKWCANVIKRQYKSQASPMKDIIAAVVKTPEA